jgi:hypothetical protein
MVGLLTKLIEFLGSLFISGAASKVKFITFRVGLAVLFATLMGAALVGFVERIFSFIGVILPMVTDFNFTPYFLPSNLDTCLGIYISVNLAGLLYRQALLFLRMKTSIAAGAS